MSPLLIAAMHRAGTGLRFLAEPVANTVSESADLVLVTFGIVNGLERRLAHRAHRSSPGVVRKYAAIA